MIKVTNFLQEMAKQSMVRAEALPSNRDICDFDKPVFELELSNFDIIAEYKANSPAEGKLLANIDMEEQILAYAQGGAAAISVLTEPTRFAGHINDLRAATTAVKHLSIPVMRKDFLVDPRQITESRNCGASGVLLITALFKPAELRYMLDCAFDHSLFVLLESFSDEDLSQSKALLMEDRYRNYASKKKLLFGVNTRDLRTLKVNSERLARLSKELPDHVPSVAESGINEVQDIVNARKHGYSLALIGTALMRSSTPEIFLKELLVAGRGNP